MIHFLKIQYRINQEPMSNKLASYERKLEPMNAQKHLQWQTLKGSRFFSLSGLTGCVTAENKEKFSPA